MLQHNTNQTSLPTATLAAAIAFLTIARAALAADPPAAIGAPQTIVDSLRSLSPARIERPFEVAPFGVEHQVRLTLEARIDWPQLAGSNPWIRVAVNGNFLTKYDPAAWNFTSVMFPITPVQLREGMVLGRQRIHTARSGVFGWPDGAPGDVYVVDGQGRRVASPAVKEIRRSGRLLYEIRMPGDHFAVLVRK